MKKTIIEINNKEYELKYTINSLIEMQEVTGIDVLNIAEITWDLKTIRILLKYAMKHENKKITDAQAGDLMGEYFEAGNTFDTLVLTLIRVLAYSLGGSDEENEESDKEIKDEEGK